MVYVVIYNFFLFEIIKKTMIFSVFYSTVLIIVKELREDIVTIEA